MKATLDPKRDPKGATPETRWPAPCCAARCPYDLAPLDSPLSAIR